MNKKRLFSLIVTLFLFGLIPLTVLAMPVPPHTNWGIISDNGTPVSDGTLITGEINGIEYASTTTFSSGGQAGYYIIEMPGDDPDTTDVIEGGQAGDTIIFKVDGVTAAETATWATGAYDELNLSISSASAPTANFTATPLSGVMPLTVVFTDASSSTITEWLWNFGDGASSTEASPSHTYNTPGVYPVSLTVTGPGGSHTETKTDYITVVGSDNSLFVSPSTATIGVGQTFVVDVLVSNITNLAGIDVELAFDPAVVEVVDANDAVPGVQITPGDCPIPGQTIENDANNSTGIIAYSTATLAPNPACSGDGSVLSITFRGLAAGDSAITFNSWGLSDENGMPILINTPQDGNLTVLDSGLIMGTVALQGRNDASGIVVVATDGATTVTGITAANGNYVLALPDGTYLVTVEMERYLDSSMSDVVVANEGNVTLPDLWLPGGDVNDDDTINILDFSVIGSHYGLSCVDANWDARTDINDDCQANIYDLTIAAGNFMAVSPVDWSQ